MAALWIAAAAAPVATLAVAPRTEAHRSAPPADGAGGVDASLYRAVIGRLREGEPYYDALGAELRARSFPRRPIFHWRTPAHLELVAALGDGAARVLLASAAVGASIGCGAAVARSGGPLIGGLAFAATVIGLAAFAVPSGVVFAEPWCAVALGVALALHASGRTGAAGVALLPALLLRELAVVVWGVFALIALRDRDRPAAAALVGAGLGWAVYFGVHAAHVLAVTRPDEPRRGWLGLGGYGELLAAARWYAPLVAVPLPVVGAAVAGIAIAAVAAPRALDGARGALVALALLVAVFGNAFNDYWGCLLVAPAGIVAPWLIPAVADTIRRARDRLRGPAPAG